MTGSSKLRAGSVAVIVLVATVVACSLFQEPEPLPPMPEMEPLPAEAALLYWVMEGAPLTRDEGIILYPDGQVIYMNKVEQRKGTQYVMPRGVAHFLNLLQGSNFAQLQDIYRPSGRGRRSPPGFATLSARLNGQEKTVQWESPAQPGELKDIIAELEQFLAVVRESAH